jgi:hypothetical protein
VPRKLRCALLCEDLEQERLLRPILQKLFCRVYVEPRKPNGGAAFVLGQVARRARTVRQRPHESVGLVIVIDGDATGLRGRLEEVQGCLSAGGLPGADSDPRIAVCVPCRNVETWELWLLGRRDLDEVTDYKTVTHGALRGVKRQGLVKRWFSPLSDEERQLEQTRLPALAHGRAQLSRLQGAARE